VHVCERKGGRGARMILKTILSGLLDYYYHDFFLKIY